jgi:hypothetical protein
MGKVLDLEPDETKFESQIYLPDLEQPLSIYVPLLSSEQNGGVRVKVSFRTAE